MTKSETNGRRAPTIATRVFGAGMVLGWIGDGRISLLLAPRSGERA